MMSSCSEKSPLNDYRENGQQQTDNNDDYDNTGLDDSELVKDTLTLTVDFTDSSKKNCKIYNVWSVANRISPQAGSNVREGLSINLIRMLGGILKDKKLIMIMMSASTINRQENMIMISPLYLRALIRL